MIGNFCFKPVDTEVYAVSHLGSISFTVDDYQFSTDIALCGGYIVFGSALHGSIIQEGSWLLVGGLSVAENVVLLERSMLDAMKEGIGFQPENLQFSQDFCF